MSLTTTLSADRVLVGMHAADKLSVIDQMLDRLAASGAIPDRAAARVAVLERERKMSTGMKNGIAIPHGKTASVDALVTCVAVAAEPVPWDTLDGEPCRIFIMTLSSPSKAGPHLQFLAEVSRLFKSEERRDAVLAAPDAQGVLDALLA